MTGTEMKTFDNEVNLDDNGDPQDHFFVVFVPVTSSLFLIYIDWSLF